MVVNMEEPQLQLLQVVRRLRAGCPWNARQTPDMLVDALAAEVEELRQALRSGAVAEICDEIGDALFNLVALAEAYREFGVLSLRDADRAAARKMVERHPYVFAGAPDPGPEQGALLWEAMKAREIEQRLAARIGVSVIVELGGVEARMLSDQGRLAAMLLEGWDDSIVPAASPSHSLGVPPRQPGEPLFLGHFAAFAHLVLYAYPARGAAVLQGYSTGEIRAASLRSSLERGLSPRTVEIVVLDCGRASARRGELL
jgi:NTP pyrophosphatase (non-canonical NTP hydrolase)/S-adenosylmethionine/arginine decarboxylase-like enzyme